MTIYTETPPIADPVPFGQLGAIGLRTYLEITSVSMVEEAAEGDTVYILVHLRNNHTEAVYATVTIGVNGIEIQGAMSWLQPGVEYSWPMMSFTMPNRSVAGTIAAFYATAFPPTEDDWVKDDEKTFGVDLKVPVAGTITRMELEYDGEQDPIPVYNIPQGQRALVHIWGRNDMATNQKLCLSWEIKDPDGLVVEQGYDWETYHTGPGGQHHFIMPPGATDYLNLNKEGSYTISLELLMNPGSPESVDTYQGVLCTVTAAPPPEYEGTITKKELEYDAEQDPIPCDVLVGLHGLVHVWGRNDMTTNQQMGLHWIIKDPDGNTVEEASDWSTLEYLPGREHHFILPPGIQDYVDFDKLGTYTMSLELLMNPDSPVVVADYDGSLCTVTSEVPPEYELIQHTIYPHAYFYEGEAEVGVATFSLPVGPPPIVDWIGAKIANALADKVEEEGSRILELKLYSRTTLPWVNYRLEATAAVTPQEGVAIWPVLVALNWKAILTAVIFVVIAIVVTNLVILPVLRLFFGRQPGLSEEVKKQWTKETLIGCIIDLRPAYSRETLEAMSDQELRDVLNEVYEEEVPPGGIAWWGWAIIAGLGIGGGALALKYLPKKKKGPEKKKKEVE